MDSTEMETTSTATDQVETVARRIRGDALSGLSDRDIETTIRVLEHVCRALDAAAEIAA